MAGILCSWFVQRSECEPCMIYITISVIAFKIPTCDIFRTKCLRKEAAEENWGKIMLLLMLISVIKIARILPRGPCNLAVKIKKLISRESYKLASDKTILEQQKNKKNYLMFSKCRTDPNRYTGTLLCTFCFVVNNRVCCVLFWNSFKATATSFSMGPFTLRSI